MIMKEYIDMTKEDAIVKIIAENQSARLVREDNVYYMITQDFVPNRLNLEIDNDIITKVYTG